MHVLARDGSKVGGRWRRQSSWQHERTANKRLNSEFENGARVASLLRLPARASSAVECVLFVITDVSLFSDLLDALLSITSNTCCLQHLHPPWLDPNRASVHALTWQLRVGCKACSQELHLACLWHCTSAACIPNPTQSAKCCTRSATPSSSSPLCSPYTMAAPA